MVEKILNNTTPSYEGSLHSSTLTQFKCHSVFQTHKEMKTIM